ncbi:MAG: tetratricopeptide repeat protein [Deltaproteobacteria bacterium]|nr:tetratricopeptide repeat protein [Deltaproteobacteria bacterium]
MDPRLARAFNNIGFCAGQLGKLDMAVAALETAIRLDPTNQVAKNNLAAIQRIDEPQRPE